MLKEQWIMRRLKRAFGDQLTGRKNNGFNQTNFERQRFLEMA